MTFPLLSALDRLGEPQLCVLGDFLLDRYTWGDAERVSPEAPVLVLRADRREARPGGAGGVCAMLRGLDAQVAAAGVVGDDGSGRQLTELLEAAGIDHAALLREAGLTTTVKERFIGRAASRHPHQILRVDHELCQAVSERAEQQLVAALVERLATCDALLVSDYNKGCCTEKVLSATIAAARKQGVPVLVDPARTADYSRYRGATLLTPNRQEAQLATGLPLEKPADALAIGRRLCELAELEAAVITLDRDGMALVTADGREALFSTEVRQVYDITGAGDMVLATIGLAVAGGATFAEAVQLANVAAGLKVEKFGAALVSREEIRQALVRQAGSPAQKHVDSDELARAVEAHLAAGRKIVFTNGCFDLLHVGHVRYLEEAARLGDVLIVAINSDRGVRALKGPTRPVIGQADRAALLSALACVDYVVVFDQPTPLELLERIRPDVLVKGGTYRADEVVGKELVESYGGRVHVAGKIEGVSTTQIVESLRQEKRSP